MPRTRSRAGMLLMALLAVLLGSYPQATSGRISRPPPPQLDPLQAQTRTLQQQNSTTTGNATETAPQEPEPTPVASSGQASDSSSTGSASGGTAGTADGATVRQTVTVVRGAQALQEAVTRGDPHIEIQEHLDLTGLKPLTKGLLLGVVPSTVRSIQGNCEGAAPTYEGLGLSGVDLLPLKPRQCVLVADGNLLAASSAALFLNRLYVRLHRSTGGTFNYFLGVDGVSRLWMTDMTLQGDGDSVRDCDSCALSSWARVYAEGCTIAHFDGYNAARVGGGGTASFVNCDFTGNHITTTFTDNAVLEADAGHAHDTLVSLQQCSFTGNLPLPPRLLSSDHSGRTARGLIYSDLGEEVTVITDSRQRWRGPAAPLGDIPEQSGLMLTAEDAELLAIQKEAAGLPREDFKGNNQLSTAIIIVLAVVSAVVVVGLLSWIVYSNYNRGGSSDKAPAEGGKAVDSMESGAPPAQPPHGIPPGVPTTTMPAPYDPKPPPPPPPTPADLGLQATNPLIPQVPEFAPSSPAVLARGLQQAGAMGGVPGSPAPPDQLHMGPQPPTGAPLHMGGSPPDHTGSYVNMGPNAPNDPHSQQFHHPQNGQNVPTMRPFLVPPVTSGDLADKSNQIRGGGAVPQAEYSGPGGAPSAGGVPITSSNVTRLVPSGFSSSPEINVVSAPSTRTSSASLPHTDTSGHHPQAPVSAAPMEISLAPSARHRRHESIVSDTASSVNAALQVEANTLYNTPESLNAQHAQHSRRGSLQMLDLAPTPTEIMMGSAASYPQSAPTTASRIASSGAAVPPRAMYQSSQLQSQSLGSATLNLPSPAVSQGSVGQPGGVPMISMPAAAANSNAGQPGPAPTPLKPPPSDGTALSTAPSSAAASPRFVPPDQPPSAYAAPPSNPSPMSYTPVVDAAAPPGAPAPGPAVQAWAPPAASIDLLVKEPAHTLPPVAIAATAAPNVAVPGLEASAGGAARLEVGEPPAAAHAPGTPTYVPVSPPADMPSPNNIDMELGLDTRSSPDVTHLRQGSTHSSGVGLPYARSDVFEGPTASGTLPVQVKPISINAQPSFHRAPTSTGEMTPGFTSGALTGGMGSPYSVNFGTYYPSVVPPPGEDAPMEDKLKFTHYQLDSIRGNTEVVDGLVMVSTGVGQERLEGGQSIVQMARGKHGGEQFSMKFFLSRQEFNTEASMHHDRSTGTPNPLTEFLPKVHNILENTEKPVLVDPSGYALPPCIITEHGEGADAWVERSSPQPPAALKAIREIARVLSAIHHQGYVHTDLRPSTVVWLASSSRWTITGLGNAERKGADTPLASRTNSTGVTYATPEALDLLRQGAALVPASTTHDAWALGVLTFEMLTRKSLMEMCAGRDEVIAQILGGDGKRLPWEDASYLSSVAGDLGAAQGPLLQLLHRDPGQRSSIDDFCRAISSLWAPTPEATPETFSW